MVIAISKTDLARNTREVVDQVRQGQILVVQTYGQDQVILLDPLDYRILLAVVSHALASEADANNSDINKALHLYLNEEVSLAKAAEMLNLSRFELMERFERLGIPLRLGPASMDEAHEEIAVAKHIKSSLA